MFAFLGQSRFLGVILSQSTSVCSNDLIHVVCFTSRMLLLFLHRFPSSDALSFVLKVVEGEVVIH